MWLLNEFWLWDVGLKTSRLSLKLMNQKGNERSESTATGIDFPSGKEKLTSRTSRKRDAPFAAKIFKLYRLGLGFISQK